MKHLKHAFNWIANIVNPGLVDRIEEDSARLREHKAKMEYYSQWPHRRDDLRVLPLRQPPIFVYTYSRKTINERNLKDDKHRQLAKELNVEWKT